MSEPCHQGGWAGISPLSLFLWVFVFLQLWQADEQIAGFDGPPVGGNYPTSLWSPGEVVEDVHLLDIADVPPGEYDLRIGLYNPTSGERLPAFGPDGPLQDYAVIIGELEVQP